MEKSVKRILSQWPALQSYFSSVKEAERPGRAKRCMLAYESVSVKLTYHFLSYALTRLNKFNVLFQVNECDDLIQFSISYNPVSPRLIKLFWINLVNSRLPNIITWYQ